MCRASPGLLAYRLGTAEYGRTMRSRCTWVIHPGSMCFHFPSAKLVLAGDTLFRGGIGRTDLWGGDFDAIEQSIKERLYTLDTETAVVTGHGAETEDRKGARDEFICTSLSRRLPHGADAIIGGHHERDDTAVNPWPSCFSITGGTTCVGSRRRQGENAPLVTIGTGQSVAFGSWPGGVAFGGRGYDPYLCRPHGGSLDSGGPDREKLPSVA